MFEQRSGSILADLSKAFDCILHVVLITKLAAYCFDYQSLRIMESFLSKRQQRTKINNDFIRYSEVIYGAAQESILGPILLNIYIWDIIKCDIASYADNNTAYNFNFSLDNVISKLEKPTNSLLNGFSENYMKANANKFNLVVSSVESCTAKIEDFSIKNSTEEKLLAENLILIFLLKIMSPVFVKRRARNYTLLQEYHKPNVSFDYLFV